MANYANYIFHILRTMSSSNRQKQIQMQTTVLVHHSLLREVSYTEKCVEVVFRKDIKNTPIQIFQARGLFKEGLTKKQMDK